MSWKVFIIAALLLCVGVVGGTTAIFTAEVTNKTSTFGGGWVGSPASPGVAGPNGADMTITWTTPTTTGVQGYVVAATNMGTTATACPGSTVTYPEKLVTLAAPASSYTATNATSQSDDGYYYCYHVRSYWTTNSWYGNDGVGNANAIRIGLYATAVTLRNNSNNLNKHDGLTLTFNQAVDAASGSMIACTNETVLLGATSCSATPSIGTLTMTGGTIPTQTTFSMSVTGSGTTTLSLTPGTNNNVNFTGSPSWTFTPSSSLQSTNGTTKAPGCTGAPCVLSVSGNF